jgi:hypothetical protein
MLDDQPGLNAAADADDVADDPFDPTAPVESDVAAPTALAERAAAIDRVLLARLQADADAARRAEAGGEFPPYAPSVLGELLGSTPRPEPVEREVWDGPLHSRPGMMRRRWQLDGEAVHPVEQAYEPEVVPPPLVAMAQLRAPELVALCSPAKLLLGITAKTPDGVLGRGWRWRAWYSVGSRWVGKRLEVPARWVRTEHVSVRLRREDPDGQTAAVVLWRRPLVHLVKAELSARQRKAAPDMRPPPTGASWDLDGAWSWRPGEPGSIPREVGATEVKAIIREDA